MTQDAAVLADALAKKFPQTFTTYGDGKTTSTLASNVAAFALRATSQTPDAGDIDARTKTAWEQIESDLKFYSAGHNIGKKARGIAWNIAQNLKLRGLFSIPRQPPDAVRMENAIRDSIEALERNSTSAPVVECLKAALTPAASAGPQAEADYESEIHGVCAELYQVIGSLASEFGVFDHPDVQRALDNASAASLTHKDLLPWPKTPLAHPQPQQADGRGAVIDIEVAARAMYEFEPWGDGTTWATMPEAGKNAFRETMRFVRAALQQSPATDNAPETK